MRNHLRIAAALLLISKALLVTASSEPPRNGQAVQNQALSSSGAVVVGRVVDASTGTPLEDATVALRAGITGGGQLFDQVRTTETGQFIFRNVPGGTWTVVAGHVGYEGTSTSGRPVPVNVVEGGPAITATVRLRRYVAVGGTVKDELDNPVPNVVVRLVSRGVTGQWTLTRTATTDDRGIYRFSKVLAGQYSVAVPSAASAVLAGDDSEQTQTLVSVRDAPILVPGALIATARMPKPPKVTSSGELMLYPMTFAPESLTREGARVIVVDGSVPIEDVDVRLTPKSARRIAGVVVGVDGLPLARKQVRLLATNLGVPDLDVGGTLTDRIGRFVFPCVVEGQYVLQILDLPSATQSIQDTTQIDTGAEVVASRRPSSEVNDITQLPTVFTRESVTVESSDVADIQLVMRNGVRVSGKITFDGTSSRPTAQQLSTAAINLRRTDGSAGQFLPGRVDAETSAFRTPQLLPGQYLLTLDFSFPSPWRVRSAVFEGHDITDVPVELTNRDVNNVTIVLTDKLPTVTGLVRDTSDRPTQAAVMLFSADNRFWTGWSRRTRSQLTSPDGTFSMTAVPAGEYILVALPELLPTWNSPEIIRDLSLLGTRITVVEGRPTNQELRLRQYRNAVIDATEEPVRPVANDQEDLETDLELPAESDFQSPRDAVGPITAKTGAITGRVMSSQGNPISDAKVLLQSSALSRTVFTDTKGYFAVEGMPSGFYRVTASKAGYLDTAYGAKAPTQSGISIALKEGNREILDLTMRRGSVLSGRILDPRGRPLLDATVKLLVRAANGKLVEYRRDDKVVQADTDDRGQYRFYGLPPGEYVVAAIPGSSSLVVLGRDLVVADFVAAGISVPRDLSTISANAAARRTVSYRTTYFPGVSTMDRASPLRLSLEESREDVDLQMNMSAVWTVSGNVVASGGVAVGGVQVTIFPSGGYVSTSAFAAGPSEATSYGGSLLVTTNSQGKFVFHGLDSGSYTIIARRPPQWAAMTVTITEHDEPNVTMPLRDGLSLSTKLAFDGTSPRPKEFKLALTRVADDGIGLNVVGQTSGQLTDVTIAELMPGRYVVTAPGLADRWFLKGIMVAGRDKLDDVIDVGEVGAAGAITALFTDHPNEIFGTFVDSSGRPVSDYHVVVFSTSTQDWFEKSRRVAAMRPNSDGSFSFKNLPPGNYRLAAAIAADINECFQPQLLQSLIGASVPLTLGDDERKRQDIRLFGFSGSDKQQR